jgi:transposase-like protein
LSSIILALTIFKERNMLVAERFISGVVKPHLKHPVSTDGETWYPQPCRFLKINTISIPLLRKVRLNEPFESNLLFNEEIITY